MTKSSASCRCAPLLVFLALAACSSSPDYTALHPEDEISTQRGIVEDFYYPPGESGGESAMDLVGRVAALSSGRIEGLLPASTGVAGPIYLIRMGSGRLIQHRPPRQILMVRGDAVLVRRNVRTGTYDVTPLKRRSMPYLPH